MKNSPDLTKLIIDIIVSVLPRYEIITEDSTIMNVETWDSLAHMGIMVAILERTGITLNYDQMMRGTSVKSLVRIIKEIG